MAAMSVLAAVAFVSMGSGYHHQNQVPERLLATASPCNDAIGVVWRDSQGARACTYGGLGAAKYGAPEELADELVYVRIDHTVIAISPWEQFTAQGHQKLERARVQWLREKGLVGGVRTHVNPAHHDHATGTDLAKNEGGEIKPRAIIHIRDRSTPPSGPLRAERDAKPLFRVLPPNTALALADEANTAG